jgi:hypothetical protein
LGLDDFHQEQDQDDEEDETEATTTVVAEAWTHTIASEAEDQYQDDEKDEHFCSVSLLRICSSWFYPLEGLDAGFAERLCGMDKVAVGAGLPVRDTFIRN